MSNLENIQLTETLKPFGHKNPLMIQRFGADPYALIYNDRVYMYMTGDTPTFDADGKIITNTYGNIKTLNVVSSDDLVNWTDHGAVVAAGQGGAAKWGGNSWAPAVAHKVMDGLDKFFIYFANGGNGIGVLTADSPIGPFVDPIDRALISRRTPNCGNVAWLFDPAVLVDDDGRAYLYFGGGIPDNKFSDPGTARVVELGADMISIVGEPIRIDVPYLFEDSGINKIGDTYYYSYCSNFNVDAEGTEKYGFNSGEIIYMTSKNPMGPFTLQASILQNPEVFFGVGGNNHHCMFEFKGQLYIAYHSQLIDKRLGRSAGYRSTNIDAVTVNEDGTLAVITGTETGVDKVKSLNPFVRTEAETIGTMAGVNTELANGKDASTGTGNMVVTDIQAGDWIAVYGADFGDNGAKSFTAAIKASKETTGAIQVRLDELKGEVVGLLEVKPSASEEYQEITVELLKTITGEHNLVFVFDGEGFSIDYWYFQ